MAMKISNGRNKVRVAFVIFSTTLSFASISSDYTIPNSFSAGAKAVASEVNDNFSAAKTAIDDNHSKITANTGNISTNAGNISTNASGISTNTGNISTNSSGISTNTGNISTNASDISTNTGNISTNASDISTNTGNISTNASGISTNTANITTNTSDITTNTNAIAAIRAALTVVKDSDSSFVGQLVSSDSRSWLVLNSNGYLVDLTGDGVPTAELVYFTNSGCTGTPYVLVNNTGGGASTEQSNPVYAKQGYVFTDFQKIGTYYIAKNTSLTSSVTVGSRYLTSGCQDTTPTIDAFQAASNVEGVTGVPNAGYGAVSLQ